MCGSPGGQEQSRNEAEGEQSGENRLRKCQFSSIFQPTAKWFEAFLTHVGAQAQIYQLLEQQYFLSCTCIMYTSWRSAKRY